ncbi:HEPN domain-containing protein [Chryseobacterium luquanense]|uniref:HEPN domain-containing protein n=1 Tax=Chryseobacterium luquanense TaxID=2983766 RepID=A0ABT3XYC3_9FLAO|nr:HEPN domain-containing protein [Chryseobacterium luquanense]MCX8530877.1 HEPN domain-containing protein [Chryseobacterium luquanense]
MITELDLSQFSAIFNKLINIPKYEFAIKKINSVSLRKNDEDSILDITSALESLLTNDSKSEITYRLSIKASQLCKIKSFNNFKTREVYELCRKIYDYRSAVIHGEVKRIEKTKKITLENFEDLEIIKISFDLLRHCLLVLLENNLDDVKAIDDILFE